MNRLLLAVFLVAQGASAAPQLPATPTHTNSQGISLVRIEPGTFTMGADTTPLPEFLSGGQSNMLSGDFDEFPSHPVTISQPFYLGATEVTNAQYEVFDPDHRALRGKLGFSREDDEAVIFVSWKEASAYCAWLSEQEGLPYRLPTEAEWEYACRAGSTTHFNTGDELPATYFKNQTQTWYPDPFRVEHYPQDYDSELVPLTVAQTPPNAWGLHDMHGNVEEWCQDWYGPYPPNAQTDPVGRAAGQFRVTRGGSHGTLPYYLRSANRSGDIPGDRSWILGFRVALGTLPSSKPLDPPALPLHQQHVKQVIPANLTKGPDPQVPYFREPRRYVNIPANSQGPLFSKHNHDPALVECPNGDLLAIWYSTVTEKSRELGLVAARLRYGSDTWEDAAPFWNVPDRNDHGPAAWNDGEGKIHVFVGLSTAATWGNLAVVTMDSSDSGATWNEARIIMPEHGTRHLPVESVFRMADGTWLLPCDARSLGQGGTSVHLSTDKGQTWNDAGGKLAGIHAGVTQLMDGRLFGFGRGDNVAGSDGVLKMPQSLSADRGKSWIVSPSVFQPVESGQRLVLMRLQDGSLFFVSFANEPMAMTDASGGTSPCKGLFAALSFDDGATWPVKRLVSDGSGATVELMDGAPFEMTNTNAEPKGYMSACQTPDGVIQLISSRQHYAFNRAWIEAGAKP